MTHARELPEKPDGLDYEIAGDYCRIIAVKIQEHADTQGSPAERAKQIRRARLYRREARRSNSGNDVAYVRTRKYHTLLLTHQAAKFAGAPVPVRRPYSYDRPDPKPFTLSPSSNEDHFRQVILPEYEKLIGKVVFPRIAIVAGQPGAGKSVARKIIQRGFGLDTEILNVDMDELRELHPNIRQIRKKTGVAWPDHTNVDSNAFKKHLLREAKRRRAPIIYENTLRRVPSVEATVKEFVADGYEVDLHTVAVNSKTSVFSIFSRFATVELLAPTLGRWVELDFHHKGYASLPDNAQHFQDKKLVRMMGVFNRDRQLLPTLFPQHSSSETRVADMIKQERDTEWNAEQRSSFSADWVELLNQMRESDRFPAHILEQARPYAEEAALLTLSAPMTPAHDSRFGQVVHMTPHYTFFDFGDRKLAELPKAPLENTKWELGNMWEARPWRTVQTRPVSALIL